MAEEAVDAPEEVIAVEEEVKVEEKVPERVTDTTKYKSKHFPKFEAEIPSQVGKNVVITGTTSGTGKIAAMTSLKKGAVVALLNRNEEKARKSLEEFFKEHPETEERTHFVLCDLQSFESVKEAIIKVEELFPEGIDVLCNNAGVMALKDEATVDGYDVQMQTNHLSHFLLTKGLYPLLVKRAEEVGEARIVNHSSGARLTPFSSLKSKYFGKNGGKLGGNGNSQFFGGARWQRYHQTKLANSVFTLELQSRLNKINSKVAVYCAHPGIAATELLNTTNASGGATKGGISFVSRLLQSEEDGTMGILKCMYMPKLVKGGMYGPLLASGLAKHRAHGPLSTNSARKMMWRESEKACGEFKVDVVSP